MDGDHRAEQCRRHNPTCSAMAGTTQAALLVLPESRTALERAHTSPHASVSWWVTTVEMSRKAEGNSRTELRVVSWEWPSRAHSVVGAGAGWVCLYIYAHVYQLPN